MVLEGSKNYWPIVIAHFDKDRFLFFYTMIKTGKEHKLEPIDLFFFFFFQSHEYPHFGREQQTNVEFPYITKWETSIYTTDTGNNEI